MAHELHLWSFFEGMPTKMGGSTFVIVDKESGVIGMLKIFSLFLSTVWLDSLR